MEERNIRQFWRQVLVPGVGATGQTKLMGRKIALYGHSIALEIAAEYLLAGGTEVTTEPLPHLILRSEPGSDWASSPAEVILLPTGILYRQGDVEGSRLAEILRQEPEASHPAPSAMVAGTLLALCCQRLLLDVSPPGVGRISFPNS